MNRLNFPQKQVRPLKIALYHTLKSPSDITFLTEQYFGEWDNLVLSSAQSNPFSLTTFAQVYQESTGIPFRIVGIFEQGQLTDGILFFEKKQLGVKRIFVPPLIPFNSFVHNNLDAELNQKSQQKIIHFLAKMYGSIAICTHPSLGILAQNVFPMSVQNGERKIAERQTYYIYLKPLAEQLAEWNAKKRTRFHAAAKKLTFAENAAFQTELVRLVALSYARHERKLPLAADKLAHLLQKLPSEMFRTFVVQDEFGTIHGSALILCHQQTAYYWLAGALPLSMKPDNPESLHKEAMFALVPQIFDALYRDGFTLLDFVGANTEGIAQFKGRFLPESVSYSYLRVENSFRLNLLDRMRRWI